MNFTWRELHNMVFARAMIIAVERHLDWPEAKRVAAQEIAKQERARAKAKPRSRPLPNDMSSSRGDISSELATAKDRLFGRLHDFFARRNANIKRARLARIAARKAEKAAKPTPVTSAGANSPAVAQPDLPAEPNVVHFPLLYSGTERSPQHIDPDCFLPRFTDETTRTWLREQQQRKRKQS